MKLKEIVNVPVELNYKSGFMKYKTKYSPETTFMIGRVTTGASSPQEGFECATPKKGVSPKDLAWTTTDYDQNKWEESYSWKMTVEGKEQYFDLSFTQNKNLTEALQGEAPFKVKPKFVDLGGGKSTIGFELLNAPVEDDKEEDLPF